MADRHQHHLHQFASGQLGGLRIKPRPDGGNNHTVNLTRNTASDEVTAFSPDGRHIVFERWQSDDTDIWRMRADGTTQVNLTSNATADDRYPSWQQVP